jgi:hypothetical protein
MQPGRAGLWPLAVLLSPLLAASCGAPSEPAARPPEAASETSAGAETAGTPEAPPPAGRIVADAVARAKTDDKIVLIEFGASWCVWCRHFESFVRSADAGPIIDDNYIVVNLVVQESDENKALEHPGGSELMTGWGGAKAGLPFYVFLDASGSKIADSNAMPDGGNIGFPVTDVEIERFMGLFDRTAPRVDPAERAVILAHLQRVAKAQGS